MARLFFIFWIRSNIFRSRVFTFQSCVYLPQSCVYLRSRVFTFSVVCLPSQSCVYLPVVCLPSSRADVPTTPLHNSSRPPLPPTSTLPMEVNLERGEDDRPAVPAGSRHPPSPPPPIINMRGSLDRGAVNTALGSETGLQRKQQQSRTLPAVTPRASRVGGASGGLTISPQARHAFDLHNQCVGAGKWSKLVIEQRQDGEHISLFSRPMAATTAAASSDRRRKRPRKPNQKRLDRQARRRGDRSSQQEQARHAQGDPSDRQRYPATQTRQQPAADAFASLQQQQQQLAPAVYTPRADVSYAAVAASPPRPAAVNRPTANSSPAVLTRAMKKRKAQSPADSAGMSQLDGAESSQPPSPEVQATGEPPDIAEPGTGDEPPVPEMPPSQDEQPGPGEPPPPPPWSEYLPSYWDRVICKFCLQGSYGYRRFRSCEPCSKLL